MKRLLLAELALALITAADAQDVNVGAKADWSVTTISAFAKDAPMLMTDATTSTTPAPQRRRNRAK